MNAILETWFAGTMAGPAIADVLFGNYNPSGKITMSFPRNVGQIPIYYNHKNTGRPFDENSKYTSKYLDVPNSPLYPFGYGLSYTNFSYGEIALNKKIIHKGEKLTANITVKNTGDYDGEETVQLYTRQIYGSVTRPVKELKSFQKVFLKKGESRELHFVISESDLKFYNNDLKFVSEPGPFKLFIGGNSQDCKEADFKLVQ
jgi:beta-glucosidase